LQTKDCFAIFEKRLEVKLELKRSYPNNGKKVWQLQGLKNENA